MNLNVAQTCGLESSSELLLSSHESSERGVKFSSAVKTNLELVILLPLPPECSDYRKVPALPAKIAF